MKPFLASLLLIMACSAHAATPTRIITIGGALTEIVYALGAQELLVGSDTTSYFPQAAEDLPKVGYLRALSAEGILSLNPELIIVSSEAGPQSVLAQIASAGVPLIQVNASRSPSDINDNISQIGTIINKEKQAQALIAQIHDDHQKLITATHQSNKRKVLFVLQHGSGSPQVAGTGTAADSIITLSGAENVAHAIQGYKPLTPEAAIALAPDIILMTERGLQQAGGTDGLFKSPGIAFTPAAKNRNVIAMDSLLMLGFGPRTMQAALELNQAYQTHE